MTRLPKHTAVLGSTGSIGCSTLDVIEASGGELQATALSAHSKLDEVCAQARRVHPRWVIATDPEAAAKHDWTGLPRDTELVVGTDRLEEIVAGQDIDIVVAAIVGTAGLRSTWAAVSAGKTIALANKETLVVAGPLVMKLAQRSGAKILPVDSEHSAIYQALQSGHRNEIARVILTASGGPFRKHSLQQLQTVTVQDALQHPTWAMGPKITIDSATMMNKALEIIEARWLFDLPAEQIDVVIHPQSIVHSLVEFVDGSVLAQLSPPDMRLPIQYALTYPNRKPGVARKLNLADRLQLEFEPYDAQRFPAVELGLEVARTGGTAGAVVSAANEAAVAAFLDGELGFTEIVPACRRILEQHSFEANPSLERLLELDRWARQEVVRWVCT
jgi:1-deoxy-D-xylulose-5-phosphate reductoisomerase